MISSIWWHCEEIRSSGQPTMISLSSWHLLIQGNGTKPSCAFLGGRELRLLGPCPQRTPIPPNLVNPRKVHHAYLQNMQICELPTL